MTSSSSDQCICYVERIRIRVDSRELTCNLNAPAVYLLVDIRGSVDEFAEFSLDVQRTVIAEPQVFDPIVADLDLSVVLTGGNVEFVL